MFWINIGRLLMLSVWSFLIFSLVHPFPKPLNIFMHIATFFYGRDARFADGDVQCRSAER